MTMYSEMLDIYDGWHSAVEARSLPSLMRVYDEDSTFESYSVVVIEKEESGVLRGKERIRAHFQALFTVIGAANAGPWFRPGPPWASEQTLLWEYPSHGHHGPQLDVVHSFDINKETDKISYHRAYWGQRGCKMLHDIARGPDRAAGLTGLSGPATV